MTFRSCRAEVPGKLGMRLVISHCHAGLATLCGRGFRSH